MKRFELRSWLNYWSWSGLNWGRGWTTGHEAVWTEVVVELLANEAVWTDVVHYMVFENFSSVIAKLACQQRSVRWNIWVSIYVVDVKTGDEQYSAAGVLGKDNPREKICPQNKTDEYLPTENPWIYLSKNFGKNMRADIMMQNIRQTRTLRLVNLYNRFKYAN